jgi:hypothetical protein
VALYESRYWYLKLPLWSSTPSCRGKTAPTLFVTHDPTNARELYFLSLQYRPQVSLNLPSQLYFQLLHVNLWCQCHFPLSLHRFVFQKNFIPCQLTGNITNTDSLLPGLQGLDDGVIFPFTILVFAALPQGPLSHLRGALAVEANIA